MFKRIVLVILGGIILYSFAARVASCQGQGNTEKAPFEIKSSVDKTSVSQDELITFTVEIKGGIGKLPDITLPDLSKDFITVSTSKQHNLTFGGSQGALIFNQILLLRAKEAGAFTIEPVKIKYEGKTYRTDEITIEVTASLNPPEEEEEEFPLEIEEGEEVIL
ncbi:BatD family protein [Candidatus Omnitrophota bacterium]